MEITYTLLFLPIIFCIPIFFGNAKIRYYSSLLLTLYISIISSIPAFDIFLNHTNTFTASIYSTEITIDGLSAFFILVTNFTMLTGMLFSNGYLEPYIKRKKPAVIALHYGSYILLHLSMLLVLVFRNGFAFLVAWELMAVASFLLILFEGEILKTLKTAVNYLIQMHIGFVFLLMAILIFSNSTGNMSFDSLADYFKYNENIGLFALFFIGFSVKAGVIPLHTWLPEAHPAAPSHVSGTMSGVMIKMGIYGIIRILSYIQYDLYNIGMFILIIAAVSGLLGVIMAIVQHDVKKLLAYHSIENIGIICIGIGLGTLGLGMNNPLVAMLGFSGALLHVLNHSLFKSLLFFSAGSVYKQYHTRSIDSFGGVIKKMPRTTFFFLIGAIAICGLPPLNGFISEMLIYIGLFKGLLGGTFDNSILMLFGIISLVLIGGLAIFCFTKVFGVVFLGNPRKVKDENVKEVSNSMLFPMLLISIFIVLIGLFPMLFIQPITNIVGGLFKISYDSSFLAITDTFSKVNIVSFVLIATTLLLFLLRSKILKKREVSYGPTWGCGSLNASAKQQYTGNSFANSFSEIASPILKIEKENIPIREEEIAPSMRRYSTHQVDVFGFLNFRIADFIMTLLKKLARLQTGKIQHYILYTFIFILIIFALMYLNLI
ncbi:MAG TPA: proton-conducting transporter membrane subunit [Candidatus Kapabacteria bacterium]|nr:proton-conducting transporter membrane subunit [Candidatus Kapabacteria bacterium]